ncbi:MAG: methyltransferase domain-containing protein [Mycobacteriales bacterium]
MAGSGAFDELVAEGAAVPVAGWDFSWLAGRATEERPPWGYARSLGRRMAAATAVVDLQTGGGEVYAEVVGGLDRPPRTVVATEGWPPNVPVAAGSLRPYGGIVVAAADGPGLPFRDGAFDLVASRHPVSTRWAEIARVLRPGGTFFSQQIGQGTMRELREAMVGPLPPPTEQRSTATAVAAAEAAGLEVLDVRSATLPAAFHDIAAVVYFLRKVVWTVPDFTVDRYREPLRRLHERIRADGPFVAHARRFLIEARKPG